MRVAIDCRYIGDRPSGIGAYVQALADRVPLLAPRDTFDLWKNPLATRPLSAAPNAIERLVAAPPNGLRTLAVPRFLAPLDSVDVLHETFNILGTGIPCPSVVTVHDLMWLLHPTWCEGLSALTPFQFAFYRNGIQRALAKATRIIAITQASADSIVAVRPTAAPRIRVVRHGVEARFAPPGERRDTEKAVETLLGAGAPFFLVVGQNAPSKFHRGILQAFAAAKCRRRTRLVLIQRLYPRGRWWIAGNERLDRVARRLDIDDRVVWLPRVSEEGIVELMRGALALVQFSRFEGFGMPVLEAMACGTPVIASDIPALVEVAGGAVRHVSLDPASLANAMDALAAEPALRDDLAHRGIERSRSFSWDRSAAQHLEVYREAARD
jgi:glycosyltransferase involved in cell wall biosynthesis